MKLHTQEPVCFSSVHLLGQHHVYWISVDSNWIRDTPSGTEFFTQGCEGSRSTKVWILNVWIQSPCRQLLILVVEVLSLPVMVSEALCGSEPLPQNHVMAPCPWVICPYAWGESGRDKFREEGKVFVRKHSQQSESPSQCRKRGGK